MLAVTAALVIAANIQVLVNVDRRFIGPTIAFWLIIVLPTYLLFTTSIWGRTSATERFAYSVGGTVLLLLLGGLLINTTLPWVGVRRPLDRLPVLILVDVINGLLYVLRHSRPDIPDWRRGLATLRTKELRLIVVAGLCVPLVIFGANRLNNQSGDLVTLIALGAIAVTVFLLLTWSEQIRSGVTGITIYLVSASLLLMTSLRGWSVTGHDIQLEYRAFQLTVAHGQWVMSAFKNAFNACLSVTILPTQVAALTRIDDPYVFKVCFQLVFAACPVIVYSIARRYFSERIAILSVIYFVGFPGFINDMPFLNRQEMALIFVAVAILAITNPRWSRRRRQAALIVATVGMEISHYSTTYVFLGTLVIAWIAGQLVLVGRFRRKRSTPVPDDRKRRWAGTRLTIGVWCIVAVGAITVTWGEFVTHVASGAADEIASAVSGFIEHSGGPKSSAVTYGLFSGKSESLQSELNEYREQTLQVRSTAPLGTYLPEKVVAAYATPVVSEPNLRLTGIGRYLSSVGVPPATVNNDVRQLAAKGEQIFVVIGLLAIILIRRRNRAVGWEFYCLGLGGLVMLVLITVLPNLSVEYGVLRVFQEEFDLHSSDLGDRLHHIVSAAWKHLEPANSNDALRTVLDIDDGPHASSARWLSGAAQS